ncbi:protein fem-1 homolog C [Euwallacea fornicatus]|uniref:protein fem-1 homolog C n=1 Tax=Euwallacea fornicatus TaxID=995702 RepID=UPI00338EDD2F
MWKYTKLDSVSEKDTLFHDLVHEVNNSDPGARLSFALRNKLEKYSLKGRKEIVNRVKQGCSPLFKACKKGQQEIAEYLINTCGADVEQRGSYEVVEDRSNHVVTPLWCAAVSGKLSIVKLLIRSGADINAVSDSGSTPIRSACFMTHFEVVKYLVLHGADINKSNHNGGTCLINSVQSPNLCHFLLKHGADVNAKDIQNKTALHYAIQEHRLETTKLLLKYGADYNAKSRYGDDALQMACLKGATWIYEYLVRTFTFPPQRICDAEELLGATFVDEFSDVSVCLQYWRHAIKIRDENGLHPKQPVMPLQECYRNQKEFETEEEILTMDLDTIRIQCLLVAERILGTHHKDTIFRLMYRGASYADVMRYQRCIEIWRRALQVRTEKDTILYTDTCFTALALVKLMVDFNVKSIQNEIDNTEQRFHDIVETFKLLSGSLQDTRTLLLVRPQYKRQLDFFEKTVKCVTHLIYLMIETAKTPSNKELVCDLLRGLIKINIKCLTAGDSILHLCVSRLNTIRSSYFLDEEPVMIFPRESVVRLLLQCGANVNAKNDLGRTPLHVAAMAYNYSSELIGLLLDYGAHLDQPDGQGDTALHAIVGLIANNCMIADKADINLVNYISLKCMCASQIVKLNIPYVDQVPKTLEAFIKSHEHAQYPN